MRFAITTLIVVLDVGDTVIFLGFLSNQNCVDISEISSQHEKLKNYKDELE